MIGVCCNFFEIHDLYFERGSSGYGSAFSVYCHILKRAIFLHTELIVDSQMTTASALPSKFFFSDCISSCKNVASCLSPSVAMHLTREMFVTRGMSCEHVMVFVNDDKDFV